MRAVDAHHDQCRRDAEEQRECEPEDEAARDAVGELPARQREDEDRTELKQADQAEVERAVVDVVDLPADGHRDHLAPEVHRQDHADEQREIPTVHRCRKEPQARDSRREGGGRSGSRRAMRGRIAAHRACGAPRALPGSS